MLDQFRYNICYKWYTLVHIHLPFLNKEERDILMTPSNWLLPKTKPVEQELVNIKGMHPHYAKELIVRLQKDIDAFDKAQIDLLAKIEEVNKLLDLNTYTSVYYALKKWQGFWKSQQTDRFPALMTTKHRPKISQVSQRICESRKEMWRF